MGIIKKLNIFSEKTYKYLSMIARPAILLGAACYIWKTGDIETIKTEAKQMGVYFITGAGIGAFLGSGFKKTEVQNQRSEIWKNMSEIIPILLAGAGFVCMLNFYSDHPIATCVLTGIIIGFSMASVGVLETLKKNYSLIDEISVVTVIVASVYLMWDRIKEAIERFIEDVLKNNQVRFASAILMGWTVCYLGAQLGEKPGHKSVNGKRGCNTNTVSSVRSGENRQAKNVPELPIINPQEGSDADGQHSERAHIKNFRCLFKYMWWVNDFAKYQKSIASANR